MPFLGCEKCGIADNSHEFETSEHGRGADRRPLCPECGRPLRSVSIREALELVRERAEAEEWRAEADGAASASARTPTTLVARH